MTRFEVLELRIGCAAPLGSSGVPSAIDKHQVHLPLPVSHLGFEGDEQADRQHHGGPHKAIHAYSISHYSTWSEEFPDRAERFRARYLW